MNKKYLIIGVGFFLVFSSLLHGDEKMKEFLISSSDVTCVKVVFSKKWPTQLEISLIKNKAKELYKLTGQNIGEKVRIIIDGHIVSEPTVMTQIVGPIIKIVPKDSGKAVELAKALTKKNNNL